MKKIEYFGKLSIFEYLLTPQLNLMIFVIPVFAWELKWMGKKFSTRTVNHSVINLKILHASKVLISQGRVCIVSYCSDILLTELIITPWIKERLLLVYILATQRKLVSPWPILAPLRLHVAHGLSLTFWCTHRHIIVIIIICLWVYIMQMTKFMGPYKN